MPRINGIGERRSTCPCEEEVLVKAGFAVREGLVLHILDKEAANRIMRAHFAAHHPGHRYEPM